MRTGRRCTFSPLFQGSVTATNYPITVKCGGRDAFSPLFQGSVTATGRDLYAHPDYHIFQSPILRVGYCNYGGNRIYSSSLCPSFSPLFSGSVTATASTAHTATEGSNFQSPILRVGYCNHDLGWAHHRQGKLSVPYSQGRLLQLKGRLGCLRFALTFSPLFSGSVTATEWNLIMYGAHKDTFSPLFQGSVTATSRPKRWLRRSIRSFSPLFQGSVTATVGCLRREITTYSFSPLFQGSVTATIFSLTAK